VSQQDVSLSKLSDPVLCQVGDRTILLTRPQCASFRQDERRHRRCCTSTELDAEVDAGPVPSGRGPTGCPDADETFRATRQPRCQLRRQTVCSNGPAPLPTPPSVRLSAARPKPSPLFGDILPFMFVPLLLNTFSYSTIVSPSPSYP